MVAKGGLTVGALGLLWAGAPADAASSARQDSSPVLIEYHLPKTVLDVSGALIVKSCAPLIVDATFEARPTAIRGPGPVRFSQKALSHGMQDTALAIATDANGVLASVNAQSVNRGPEVLGNIVKIVLKVVSGTVAFAQAGGDKAPLKDISCSERAGTLTKRMNTVMGQILQFRTLQDREPSLDRQAHIDTLEREVMAIQQNLRLPWSAIIDIDARPGNAGKDSRGIAVNGLSFALRPEAFPVDPATLLNGFEPAKQMSIMVHFPRGFPEDAGENQSAYLAPRSIPKPEEAALILPTPVEVHMDLRLQFAGMTGTQDSEGRVSLAAVPMPQWGPLRTLKLRETFGGGRQFQAQLDPFGRATSVTFSASSRAAAVTGGLAGTVGDVEAFAAANSAAARTRAEADQLETEQRRNRLRACKEAAGNAALWWDCDTLLTPQPSAQ